MSFFKTKEVQDLRAKYDNKRCLDFYAELVALMDKYHGITEAKSFPTKAAQKDFLDYLNRAYDMDRHYVYKSEPNMHGWKDTIYNLCHVREKHRKFNDPEKFDRVMKLVELREYYKAMPIVKKAPQKKLPQKTALACTHKGTCQICFKEHCVKNNSLLMVDHGYNISEGRGWYFGQRVGSCNGWDHLPLEKDCSLVKETYQDWFNGLLRMRANRNEQYFKYDKRLKKDVPVDNPYNTHERKWLLKDLRTFKDIIKNWAPKELKEVEFADENNV